MSFEAATGRGVRIAVVDSGINPLHPHIRNNVDTSSVPVDQGRPHIRGGIGRGVSIDEDGNQSDDILDRLGHGTAVAAAIREKAPDAQLFGVRVFHTALSTTVASLCKAIEWSVTARMHLVNLSLGTDRPEHEAIFGDIIARGAAHGTIIVGARGEGAARWFPGSLPGVVAVQVDWSCPRDEYRVIDGADGPVFQTSGYPRSIPGVPPERNLRGTSFAVANMTGFVARALEAVPEKSLPAVVAILRSAATVPTI